MPALDWIFGVVAVTTLTACEVGRLLGFGRVLARMRHANSAGWGAMFSGTLDDAAKEAAARRQSLELLGASHALFLRVVVVGAIVLIPVWLTARLLGLSFPKLIDAIGSPPGLAAVAAGAVASIICHRRG